MKIGPFLEEEICDSCEGVGMTIKNKCSLCKGKGLIEAEDVVNIRIPALVEDGQTIVANKKGNESTSSYNGDLNLKVKITESRNFSRKGTDIYLKKEIDYVTAILGGNIHIETLTGMKTVFLKQFIKHNEKLCFKGEGAFDSKKLKYGDFYVEFELVPTLEKGQKK